MSFFETDDRSRMRRRCCLQWVAALIAALCFTPGRGMAGDLELTVKSAYIYNFIQFIDWQRPETGAEAGPIKIGVIGSEQFASALKELSSRRVNGRSIEVEAVSPDAETLTACHVVFIGQSAEDRLSRILSQLAGANVLTVSDISQFARKGGGIGFVIKGGKVKIEINPNATRQAGLKVSAKLLEVARIVE